MGPFFDVRNFQNVLSASAEQFHFQSQAALEYLIHNNSAGVVVNTMVIDENGGSGSDGRRLGRQGCLLDRDGIAKRGRFLSDKREALKAEVQDYLSSVEAVYVFHILSSV